MIRERFDDSNSLGHIYVCMYQGHFLDEKKNVVQKNKTKKTMTNDNVVYQ